MAMLLMFGADYAGGAREARFARKMADFAKWGNAVNLQPEIEFRGKTLPDSVDPLYDRMMEARVAVLEQIARDTRDGLADIRQDVRDMRQDFKELRQDMMRGFERVAEEMKDIRGEIKDVRGELKDVRTDAKTDFRILFGALITAILGLAYVMARGLHWLQ